MFDQKQPPLNKSLILDMYRRVFADNQSSTGGHTLERDFITNGYINQPIVTW